MPPISYKTDAYSKRKSTFNSESLNLDIKTHPGKKGSKKILLDVPALNIGYPEYFVHFFITLTNISKVWGLNIGPQMYAVTSNLLTRESLHVF